MEFNNENLFWNQAIKKYKSQYGNKLIETFLGISNNWEYKMLLEVGAITSKGISMAGYVVRDKTYNLLYNGRDGVLANKIKNEAVSNSLDRGSNLYASYAQYKMRLLEAKRGEDNSIDKLIENK